MFWWIALGVVALIVVGWWVGRGSRGADGRSRGVDQSAVRRTTNRDQWRGSAARRPGGSGGG